jgi:hypothetical protein
MRAPRERQTPSTAVVAMCPRALATKYHHPAGIDPMKRNAGFLAVLLLAALAAALPVTSHALKQNAVRPTDLHATHGREPTALRWWGALAGTICRFGSGPYNPYGGYCIIALLDALTS